MILYLIHMFITYITQVCYGNTVLATRNNTQLPARERLNKSPVTSGGHKWQLENYMLLSRLYLQSSHVKTFSCLCVSAEKPLWSGANNVFLCFLHQMHNLHLWFCLFLGVSASRGCLDMRIERAWSQNACSTAATIEHCMPQMEHHMYVCISCICMSKLFLEAKTMRTVRGVTLQCRNVTSIICCVETPGKECGKSQSPVCVLPNRDSLACLGLNNNMTTLL